MNSKLRKVLSVLLSLVLLLSLAPMSVLALADGGEPEDLAVLSEAEISGEEALPPQNDGEEQAPAPQEPAAEPVAEPATEPVAEPATEPVVEPATEPVVEPATEPVVEPATEPAVEPTDATTAEEPANTPTTEPAEDPADAPILPLGDPATYSITVNGGTAYDKGGNAITSAAAGDLVYIRFDDDAAPEGKYISWGSAVTDPFVFINLGMISGTEFQAGFTMPESNITVSPDYLDQKPVTVDLTSGDSTDETAASNAEWALYRAEKLGLIKADHSNSYLRKFDLDKDDAYDVVYYTNDKKFSVMEGCSVTGDKVLTIQAAEYSPVTFKLPVPIITYPVWVGSTQVTGANKDDILGDGTASFEPVTNTLTLDNPTITGYAESTLRRINAEGIDLTVKGKATIDGGQVGIMVEGGSLILNGDFTITNNGYYAVDAVDVTIEGGQMTLDSYYAGINTSGSVTIAGGTVTSTGSDGNGINASGSVTIEGGTVTLTGGSGNGINADSVIVSGGTVTAKGSEYSGIFGINGVEIKNGIQQVEADGVKEAIHASLGVITIGDALMIKEPEDGINDGHYIYESDEVTTATHALIVPKEVEKFPVEVVVTTWDKNGNLISSDGGTAIADKTEVAKGETISVTVTPYAGFALDTIIFGDGTTLGYQNGKETSSTVPDDFTTSSGSLVIDVIFKETATAPVTVTHKVTFESNGGSAVPAQTVNDGEKAAKPADPTRSGYVFDGWYADAAFAAAFDFNAPITADVTVYAKWTEVPAPVEIVYTVVTGGSSTWTKGSSGDVTIVVKRNVDDDTCFSHFTNVQIDGTTLASGDYEAKAGSTVVTLKASALQKLSTGTKTITVNFDDGKAETSLTIKAASTDPGKKPGGSTGTGKRTGSTPRTGDNSNTGLWLLMMILSGMSLLSTVWNGKKRRRVSKR